MRLLGVALVVCALGGVARAQVDTGNGRPSPTHLDLPRSALDVKPPSDDLHVPPAWRDVQRDAAAAFQPSATVVSRRGPAALVAKQLGAWSAAVRAIEEGHGDPAITGAHDEAAELRRRFEEEPAEWARTEIEVRVAGNGDLESIAVVAPSGRHELDEAAVRVLTHALGRLRPRGRKAATVRFACDAGVVAAPPILGKAAGDPRGQGVTAGMRLRFDETTGKVEPLVPFVRRVVTRIYIVDYADGGGSAMSGPRK